MANSELMTTAAISSPFSCSASLFSDSRPRFSSRNLVKLPYSTSEHRDRKFGRFCCSYTKLNKQVPFHSTSRHAPIIEAKKGIPPVMPAVMTPGGPLDLSSVLFRNRIIFIGQPVNSQVAQRVISQLITLAAVDEDADILV